MCGITGVYSPDSGLKEDDWERTISAMVTTLRHRGPDDYGTWTDASVGVGLGHRRLSIVDLTSEGHQPMHSASQRYVLAFNGEIYNYQSLRNELRSSGLNFRGASDTEVLLAAIESWGVERAVKRCIGMFAFALWDRREQNLTLCRDRLGEKPLYYGVVDGFFLFGSELKALKAFTRFSANIDFEALGQYLRYSYVPAPFSIYQGINKLPPGTFLTITRDNIRNLPLPERYWSIEEVALAGMHNTLSYSEAEAVEHLDELLRQAVKMQMVADVPIGAFLSGGVDSSTIVSLMQMQSAIPVKTFSIGFSEQGYNEAGYAKAIAKHLGTEHSELYLSPQQAMEVIYDLPEYYDEPFADPSQIPTLLVAKLAKRSVAVSLSGDGGDELFCGYTRYLWGESISKLVTRVPSVLRKTGAKTISTLSPDTWDKLISNFTVFMPRNLKQTLYGDKLYKLAQGMLAEKPGEIYDRLVAHWTSDILICKHNLNLNAQERNSIQGITNQMMYRDMTSYLPDDILVKLDRASMGVSLESRVPLLDHRIVEFAWKVPLSMKLKNGQGKWLLRQVLYRYVPKELIERPKMGFSLPIEAWLRGPLREWAESLLSVQKLNKQGLFTPGPIRQKWLEHLSGKRNWQHHLWDILMFQAWYEKNMEGKT